MNSTTVSDENDKFIVEARGAWHDGYAIVAAAINPVVEQAAKGRRWKRIPRINAARIDADPHLWGDALRSCRGRLTHALLRIELPYHVLREIDDSRWQPWVIGRVNGDGETWRIGLAYREVGGEEVEQYVSLLLTRVHWLQRDWRRFIIDPVEGSATEWNSWLDRILAIRAGRTAFIEEARSVGWPPDQGWHFVKGLFAFRGNEYELSGIPLQMLVRFINSAAPALGPNELRDVWSETEPSLVEPATIRTHVGSLRKVLKCVAKDTGAFAAIQADPLPNRGGSWRFRLPKA